MEVVHIGVIYLIMAMVEEADQVAVPLVTAL
jgi:hypothetical protein